MLSPELKHLSTRITPTKISQDNQLGAAHPAGFLSIDSLHRESSHMLCSLCRVFAESRGIATLRNSQIFITGLQRKCGLKAPAHPIPSCPPFHPYPTPSYALPGCFLSQPSLLTSLPCLQPVFSCQTLSSFFSPQCKCKVGQGYSVFSHETLRCPHGFYCTAIPQLSWLHFSVQSTLFAFLPLLPDLEIFKWHTHFEHLQ